VCYKLKTQMMCVAKGDDLDFDTFDFDDFADWGSSDADARASSSSSSCRLPAPADPVKMEPKIEPVVVMVPKIEPVVVSAPVQAMPVFNFYFGPH
jgi:hypothetical protein